MSGDYRNRDLCVRVCVCVCMTFEFYSQGSLSPPSRTFLYVPFCSPLYKPSILYVPV